MLPERPWARSLMPGPRCCGDCVRQSCRIVDENLYRGWGWCVLILADDAVTRDAEEFRIRRPGVAVMDVRLPPTPPFTGTRAQCPHRDKNRNVLPLLAIAAVVLLAETKNP